jgi:cytochrome c556
MRMSVLTIATIAAVSIGALANAEGHISDKQIEAAMKARQSHMQLYSFHLATLGSMAKDEIAYDTEAASASADSIVALTGLSQAGYWVPGSDSDSVEGSRALPAIWADGSDIGAKAGALTDAALAVQAAAATDLDALKAAMGPLGKAFGACHETYRLPKN